MDKIVVVETFYNPIEASIVKARLLDNGIECFLSDEHTAIMNPLYNQAIGGVKLHVFEKDVPQVKSILQNKESEIVVEDIENGTDICPKCGSNNVAYVQATKKRFNIFTIIISFFLFVYPFHAEKTLHCFKCEHEF